jgi:hypothetical protein
MTGFSACNVWDMRRLYESYTPAKALAQGGREVDFDEANPIQRQPVAELSETGKRISANVIASKSSFQPSVYLSLIGVASCPV